MLIIFNIYYTQSRGQKWLWLSLINQVLSSKKVIWTEGQNLLCWLLHERFVQVMVKPQDLLLLNCYGISFTGAPMCQIHLQSAFVHPKHILINLCSLKSELISVGIFLLSAAKELDLCSKCCHYPITYCNSNKIQICSIFIDFSKFLNLSFYNFFVYS